MLVSGKLLDFPSHQLDKQFGCPERQGVMRCMSRRTDVGRCGPGERHDWSRKKPTNLYGNQMRSMEITCKMHKFRLKYSASPRFLGYFRIIWENHGESSFTGPSGSWLMKWCWPGEHGKHQYHFGHKFSLHSPNSETTWIIQIHLLGLKYRWGDQRAWGQRQVVQCKCFSFNLRWMWVVQVQCPNRVRFRNFG